MITVDQGVPHQQYLVKRRIAILVIRARTNQLADLLPLIGRIMLALSKIRPGQVLFID